MCMFWNLIVLKNSFWLSICHILIILGLDLNDYLFKLKKVWFDTLKPLDMINNVYTVICFEKLNLISLKGCLDMMVHLCYRLCRVLFLFDVSPMWPKWLSKTSIKGCSMVDSQIDTWLSHYEHFEIVIT